MKRSRIAKTAGRARGIGGYLESTRSEGALEALVAEEGEEAPVPEPPHDRVLRRAGELVVAAILDASHRSADPRYEESTRSG